MLGFDLDFWDYATFAALFVLVLSGGVFIVWIAGLPGRIAIARKHPDAEAVKLMGLFVHFVVRSLFLQGETRPSPTWFPRC